MRFNVHLQRGELGSLGTDAISVPSPSEGPMGRRPSADRPIPMVREQVALARARSARRDPNGLPPGGPAALRDGALPVLEGQHLVGIITERDLTAALAEGADPVLTPVSDYMTPAPEVLGPDSSSPTRLR